MKRSWHATSATDAEPPVDHLDHWPRRIVDVLGDEAAIEVVQQAFGAAETCATCGREFRHGEHRSLRVELEGDVATVLVVGHVQCMRPSLSVRERRSA